MTIVFLATQHDLVMDCPADLEVEDEDLIGVYDNETKAKVAIEARRIEICELDGTDIDDWDEEYGYGRRFSVREEPVK